MTVVVFRALSRNRTFFHSFLEEGKRNEILQETFCFCTQSLFLFAVVSAWIVPQLIIDLKQTDCLITNTDEQNSVKQARLFGIPFCRRGRAESGQDTDPYSTLTNSNIRGVTVNHPDLSLCQALKNQLRIKLVSFTVCQKKKPQEIRKLLLCLTQRDSTVLTAADTCQIPAVSQHWTSLLVWFTGHVAVSKRLVV